MKEKANTQKNKYKNRIMNKVNGKVLLKEIGVGIPNLLIVVYDLDPQTKIKELLNAVQTNPSLDFWNKIKGDRLGSVLTNQNGEFELCFEESDFQVKNKEKRPDLILFVMASEERQTGQLLASSPSAQRILHFSNIPRANAGRMESYIINLSCSQLGVNNTAIPDSQIPNIPTPTKESILQSLDNSFELEDAIQAKLNERTAKKTKKANEASKKAKKAFEKFSPSSFSFEQRNDPTYLSPWDRLKNNQETIIKRNLESVEKSSKKRIIPLFYSKEELKQMSGITLMPDGTYSGEANIELEEVILRMEDRMESTALFAIKDPLALCRAEMGLDDVLASITGATGREESTLLEPSIVEEEAPIPLEEVTPENPVLTDSDSIKGFIRSQIEEYLQKATPPENSVRFEDFNLTKRANQSDLKNGINALKIEGGPADVTSFHDFYDLQIAFEHVWTEVFDGEVGALGQSIFREWVKLEEFTEADAGSSFVSMENLESFLVEVQNFQETVEVTIPPDIIESFGSITEEQWTGLGPSQQQALGSLAREIYLLRLEIDYAPPSSSYGEDYFRRWAARQHRSGIRREGLSQLRPEDRALIIAQYAEVDALENANRYTLINQNRELARGIIESATITPENERREAVRGRLARLNQLVSELNERLKEAYNFHVFAKDFINYGLLINYRQEWKPIQYQVGDLVTTIPLAPKETRKYTKKRVIKKSRQEKEVENALQIRKEESSNTSRIDSEVIRKANNKTNFKITAEASGSIGLASGSSTAEFGADAERSSSRTKKTFRESVVKAAQEFKQEHKLEIETKQSEEFETTESGEITNPNDELTVTYLFYELQRIFEISEKIHQLTPVILVANEVPAPNEIDEDWLIAHDWIIRRVILDDSFVPALNLLSESLLGNEISLAVLRTNVDQQTKIAQEIKNQVVFKEGSLAAGIADDDERQAAESELNRFRSELTAAISAVQEATNQYTQAIKDHFDRQAEITRLRIHIKDNIIYYMKAIWDHEPTDQRFFRLYHIEVPVIGTPTGSTTITVGSFDTGSTGVFGGVGNIGIPGTSPFGSTVEAGTEIAIPASIPITRKKLVEVADLENLLGYKGNYMIFPLKKNNYLTTYMMQPYIDEVMGRIVLKDPDSFGNLTSAELIELFKCVYKKYPEGFTDEVKAKVREELSKKLSSPRKEKEIIIVPSDSLYIESLPGSHPILEDFKLIHRAIDVKKVQAEVRHAELENLRLAARLLEGEREDPDVDKKIIIKGDGAGSTINIGDET